MRRWQCPDRPLRHCAIASADELAEDHLVSNALPADWADTLGAELADLYRSFGRRAEMIRTLESLKAHASSYESAYEVAGKMYLGSGDFRQAIREYEQGIAAFPKYKAGYQKLIVEALNAGNQRAEAATLLGFGSSQRKRAHGAAMECS